jgi:hypothetical protein
MRELQTLHWYARRELTSFNDYSRLPGGFVVEKQTAPLGIEKPAKIQNAMLKNTETRVNDRMTKDADCTYASEEPVVTFLSRLPLQVKIRKIYAMASARPDSYMA